MLFTAGSGSALWCTQSACQRHAILLQVVEVRLCLALDTLWSVRLQTLRASALASHTRSRCPRARARARAPAPTPPARVLTLGPAQRQALCSVC